jgi:hypothetical protein
VEPALCEDMVGTDLGLGMPVCNQWRSGDRV